MLSSARNRRVYKKKTYDTKLAILQSSNDVQVLILEPQRVDFYCFRWGRTNLEKKNGCWSYHVLVLPMTLWPCIRRSSAIPSASSSPWLFSSEASRALRRCHERDMHQVTVARPLNLCLGATGVFEYYIWRGRALNEITEESRRLVERMMVGFNVERMIM